MHSLPNLEREVIATTLPGATILLAIAISLPYKVAISWFRFPREMGASREPHFFFVLPAFPPSAPRRDHDF